MLPAQVRDADTPSALLANPVIEPSPYFGKEALWNSRFNAHTPTMDAQGRIYFAAQTRSPKKRARLLREEFPAPLGAALSARDQAGRLRGQFPAGVGL